MTQLVISVRFLDGKEISAVIYFFYNYSLIIFTQLVKILLNVLMNGMRVGKQYERKNPDKLGSRVLKEKLNVGNLSNDS
jgi:hypothetical protein